MTLYKYSVNMKKILAFHFEALDICTYEVLALDWGNNALSKNWVKTNLTLSNDPDFLIYTYNSDMQSMINCFNF